MEQPEIFTPAAYHELLASLQPVYGLTAGLTNKMVSKAVAQVLERCAPAQDYLPEKIRARYELCEINYALHEVHFPKDQEHLATARRRIVFEEFFLFILSLRQLKEQTEGITNVFRSAPSGRRRKSSKICRTVSRMHRCACGANWSGT